MNKRWIKALGFTLVELMIVVVIVGLLAAVAIPGYMRHIKKTKANEAVTNVSGIAQYEEAYFAENDQYLSCDPNPATVPTPSTPQSFSATTGAWANLGRVIPSQPVLFSYVVRAGSASSLTGAAASVATQVNALATSGGTKPNGCSSGGPSNAYSTYVDTSVNPHWFFAAAWGDQDGDGVCSFFGLPVDRSTMIKMDELE